MLRLSVVAMEVGSAAAFSNLAQLPGTHVFVSDTVSNVGVIPGAKAIARASVDEIVSADVVLCSMTGAIEEREIVAKAREKRVATVQMLDTWGPYPHRTRAPLADKVAVIDEAARQEAIEAGVEPSAICIVGQPAWERVERRPSAPPNRIAFLSQPISRLYGCSLGYDETTALEMLDLVAARRPDLIERVLVVPHPGGCALAADARASTLAEALQLSGTVVGMFSSAMVDAVLCGRAVVSLQPQARGVDRCALSRFGRIPHAHSADGLESALAQRRLHSADDLVDILRGSQERLLNLISEVGRH